MLRMEEEGHNPGGIHQEYRAIKTFIYWYWWVLLVIPECHSHFLSA